MKANVSVATLVSAVAGFLGGMVSQRLAAPVPASAQMIIPAPNRPQRRAAATEVDAQRFVLVDPSGNVQAEIKMQDGMPQIVLYDKEGRVGWRATPNHGIHPLSTSNDRGL